MAAMVGLVGVRRVKPSGPSSIPSRGANDSIALRSAPAQNDTPPAPVSTSTRASSSASKRAVALGEQRRRGPVDRVPALLAVDREHRGGTAALIGHLVGVEPHRPRILPERLAAPGGERGAAA